MLIRPDIKQSSGIFLIVQPYDCRLAPGRAGKDAAAMPLDLDEYRPYLNSFDLTDDQKTAMIEALWSIAEAVADLAYGMHSTQLVEIAVDNDSSCDSSVIEFFQLAANDPVLDKLTAIADEHAADNDNLPLSQQQEKEAGT